MSKRFLNSRSKKPQKSQNLQKNSIDIERNVPSMYDALSHPSIPINGHEANENIYKSPGEPVNGVYEIESRFNGYIKNKDVYEFTNIFEIAYTKWGMPVHWCYFYMEFQQIGDNGGLYKKELHLFVEQ